MTDHTKRAQELFQARHTDTFYGRIIAALVYAEQRGYLRGCELQRDWADETEARCVAVDVRDKALREAEKACLLAAESYGEGRRCADAIAKLREAVKS